MGKELSEMTLEELWDLFPVFLVRHDDRWNEYYMATDTDKVQLKCVLARNLENIF